MHEYNEVGSCIHFYTCLYIYISIHMWHVYNTDNDNKNSNDQQCYNVKDSKTTTNI